MKNFGRFAAINQRLMKDESKSDLALKTALGGIAALARDDKELGPQQAGTINRRAAS
jgi:hypothetical protein